jgi:hypothetical protein
MTKLKCYCLSTRLSSQTAWLALLLISVIGIDPLIVDVSAWQTVGRKSTMSQLSKPTIFRDKTGISRYSSTKDETNGTIEKIPGKISANSVYMDIEVANQPVGRLVFHLTNPSPLPFHAENFVQLIKGSRRGIDPKAHYVGCQFDYSPATVEDGMGRYRWGHQMRGRGRNAIGRADQPISDPENQLQNTHACFGGQYYGDVYATKMDGDPGVVLTVPVVGPGYGSSKFSIVRVGESPMEWRERLLINSGIIGRMDPSSLETLHAMARQKMGPPTLVASGVLD